MKRWGLLLVAVLLLGLFTPHINTKTLEPRSLTFERVEYSDTNKLLSPIGEPLVTGERYSVEKLDSKIWVALGEYRDSAKLDKKVTKDYTAYQVLYEAADIGTKSTVRFMAPAKGEYRITWTMTVPHLSYKAEGYGVNYTTGPDEWVYVSWVDVIPEWGDIATYKVDGDTLTVTFRLGELEKDDKVALDPVVVDSYSEANRNTQINLNYKYPSVVGESAVGQSFTNDAPSKTLLSAKFYLDKTNNPTGNLYARLYEHAGTYGVNSTAWDGWAMEFDGNDDVTIADDPTLDHMDFTVSMWVKIPGGSSELLASHAGRDGWYMQARSSNVVRVVLRDATGAINAYDSVETLSLSIWNHVAFTFLDSNNTLRIYVNGVYKQFNGVTQPENENRALEIAYSSWYGTYGNITLDEFRQYNRTLSPTDISYSIDNFTPKNTTGLAAWINFDKNVDDHSGESNDGSTNGNPQYVVRQAPLATSGPVDIATVGGGFSLHTFDFNASEQYEMQADTYYCIVVQQLTGNCNATDYVSVGIDTSAPSHDGNALDYANGAWRATPTDSDTIFYVYGTGVPTNEQVDSDSIFTRNVEGWMNVTVSDTGGVTDLTTVTVQVNTTQDSENFTLRWTQATGVFSEVSDPDDICSLDTVNSTRVNLNATYDRICFLFNMTGGASGACDVEVTTVNDYGFSDTDLYASEFEFSYYSWDEQVYDWIDSAFEQFGVFNYMSQITVFLEGLSVYFNDSLTHLLALVVQQFRVITNVYNFAVFWITELIGVALDFSVFYQSVLDGTSGWGTGIGDFWEIIEYDLWAPVVPLLLFIWWMESLAKRGAQTVGGELQVFINDMNTGISILSYFVSMFSLVVNTVIDRAYGLFDAIV